MDISKYVDYFHDGTIHDIKHIGNEIIFFMESSQLLPEWNKDNIILSKNETISGGLHINNIKNIDVNNKPHSGLLRKTYDSSDIYDFEINDKGVKILVSWTNYPPNLPEETDVFTIEIEGEKIFWENIPHMFEHTWE